MPEPSNAFGNPEDEVSFIKTDDEMFAECGHEIRAWGARNDLEWLLNHGHTAEAQDIHSWLSRELSKRVAREAAE